MALYAFDGTWNRVKDGEDLDKNTNVVRFYDAYDKRSGTKNFYVSGVGTRFDVAGKILGGAFGLGQLPRLNEAYDHLCERWAAGDQVIDIVGFSRGAATTLDFCHIIQERKIRRPKSKDVVEGSPRIRFLGLWDVVAGFGLANLGMEDLNIGHHLSLPKTDLQYAFHALALDERRPSFLPTRLHGAYEVWFRGVHSDVGGGNGKRGLNDVALKWMMNKAKAAGLPVASEDITALHPNSKTPASIPAPLKLDIRHVSSVDRRHYTVEPSEGCRTPPGTCLVETEMDEQRALEVGHDGVETLPAEFGDRFATLATLADAEGQALELPFGPVREAILSLIEARMPLVTDEARLAEARRSVTKLIAATERHAKQHGFHALNEFFVNEALFELRPLFPFTD